jgi:hypothetical protein
MSASPNIYINYDDVDDFISDKIFNILKIYSKYPIIGPGWGGEHAQKIRHILYNNNISLYNFFGPYYCLLRNIIKPK